MRAPPWITVCPHQLLTEIPSCEAVYMAAPERFAEKSDLLLQRGHRPYMALESVPKLQQGLQSFRNMRRMEASFKNARALQLRFSQSLARRRQRLSHAIVRSTIQRLGNCTNPFAWSDRLTISVSRRGRNLASALAKIGPWYALSANSFSRNGN